jgi:hypothetical protein
VISGSVAISATTAGFGDVQAATDDGCTGDEIDDDHGERTPPIDDVSMRAHIRCISSEKGFSHDAVVRTDGLGPV